MGGQQADRLARRRQPGRLIGVRPTGVLLALPALLPALVLVLLPVRDGLTWRPGCPPGWQTRKEPLRHNAEERPGSADGAAETCQLTFRIGFTSPRR